jgi:hypothetical protein
MELSIYVGYVDGLYLMLVTVNSVALHRRNDHQELDLRGRREGARGGIEGTVSQGPLFIAPDDTL